MNNINYIGLPQCRKGKVLGGTIDFKKAKLTSFNDVIIQIPRDGVYNLDLYVLGDDALISLRYFMQTKHLCLDPH